MEKLQDTETGFGQNFNVSELSFLGSFVRGEETQESDLDVLVTFSIMPSFFQFIDLRFSYLKHWILKSIWSFLKT